MKKTKINKLVAMGCLLAGIGLTGCEDWLTIYPNSQIVEENFWEDKNDLQSVRYAVYKNMLSTIDKYFVWGELRADYYQAHPSNFNQEVTNLLKADLQATDGYTSWATFYNTINFCNKVLEHGEEIMAKDASFTLTDWLPIQAEMYGLRALNYFYLIRAFGNVPYVTVSINDDTQTANHPAVSQLDILNDCLLHMENTVGNAVNNYGTWTDNKAFMTKNAIYALMADMYLWRASLLQGQGEEEKALADYARCNECCQIVIDKIREQTEEYNKTHISSGSMGGGSNLPGSGSTDDDPYDFLIQTSTRGNTSSSGAYNAIFADGNSTESIFELQCTGDNNTNPITASYLYGDKAKLQASSKLYSASTTTLDQNANMYYKTDLRKREATDYDPDNKTYYYIQKLACTAILHTTEDIKDNTIDDSGSNPKFEALLSGGATTNWIIYRVTDIMLMKADALNQMNYAENKDEAFALVEAVYKRSNPYPYENNTLADMLPSTKANSKDNLEELILRERQREFVAEGKRWFDLVRYALRKSTTEGATPENFLTILTTGMEAETGNVLKKKLISMKSLYLPINETELKANPQLTQNPVWNKNQDISKN
ncbi:MAG: RagB/SusD family nutrient uptake outer membrane protein [Clostridium sp.]|nr:RagB/SusD family nutrient uptake outer membrane protein [Clostridium sp.]